MSQGLSNDHDAAALRHKTWSRCRWHRPLPATSTAAPARTCFGDGGVDAVIFDESVSNFTLARVNLGLHTPQGIPTPQKPSHSPWALSMAVCMPVSGGRPTAARSTFSSIARCLDRALITVVPGGARGAFVR